jgi:hypothetical protein
MAKKCYVGVNNLAQNCSKIYVGVNNVARKVVKGYVGVNGVAQQFWLAKPPYALYWHGDLCTDITGGWETTAQPSWSGSTCVAPVVTYGSDSVSISQDSYTAWSNKVGQWKTVNLIDMSNFVKCYIRSSGSLQKGGTSSGMHAVIDFYLNDDMSEYQDPNYVDEYYRKYSIENSQTSTMTWTNELCSFILNPTVLSKGFEYFLVCEEMNSGRGNINISEIWLESGYMIYNRSNFYHTPSGTIMSDYIIDRSIPTVGEWPVDLTVNVRQYLGTNKILMIGQDHATVWAQNGENIKYQPPSSGACTCVLCIPIQRIYGAKTITIEWKTTQSSSNYPSQFGCLKINDDMSTTQHGATPSLSPETSWTSHTINIPSSWEYVDYVTVTAVTWITEVRAIVIQ